jgi:hypothetical protein
MSQFQLQYFHPSDNADTNKFDIKVLESMGSATLFTWPSRRLVRVSLLSVCHTFTEFPGSVNKCPGVKCKM